MDVRERIWIMVRTMEEIFHTVKCASFIQQLTMDFGMLYCILKAEEGVVVRVILWCLITGNTWMLFTVNSYFVCIWLDLI
jgi:hypothetical protein